MVNEPVMHPETEGGAAEGRQRYVVTRQINALKSVDLFEVA